jgi:predicted ATP-grasp superfamily ATP-dependent carboligase
MHPPHDLLILGASARAAAFSALRGGLRPCCADYFADVDLTSACPVDQIEPEHAADQFCAWAEKQALTPWVYTGGFENHPEWVERISRRHPLWGVKADALARVRSPFEVVDVLSRHGLPCPAVRRDSAGLPRDGTWLAKPLASGGGRAIEPLSPDRDLARADFYFQERIEGPSFSALFLGVRSTAMLVGVSRQIIGFNDALFLYRGSIGPWQITPPLSARLERLGDVLAQSFELQGLFGVDYIERDQVPWPVEVNPRYTASAEVHERARGISLLAAHRDACISGSTKLLHAPAHVSTSRPMTAKSILYATRRLVAPEITDLDNGASGLADSASLADIPRPGTVVDIGEPVMTLLATAGDLAGCLSRMNRLTEHWTLRLGLADTPPPSDMQTRDPWRWD